MESPEKIWFLMSRNLSGEAAPEEQEELMAQLQQRPDLMQQYEMMKRMWDAYAGFREAGPAETSRINRILQLSAAEDALRDNDKSPRDKVQSLHEMDINEHFTGRMAVPTPSISDQAVPGNDNITAPAIRRALNAVYGRVAIAAGLLLGLWAVAHWWSNGHSNIPANEIIAKRGSKTRTILPDGSTVWLNAGSRIQYEPGFNRPLREVTLQGEAFFDVVKQPSRPFIVHAGDLNIKVLGTAFNVKSYDEDKIVETTLIRGLVQITRPADDRQAPIYLHPHEKIVLPRKDPESPAAGNPPAQTVTKLAQPRIIPIDSSMKEDERVETSWVYNRLEFRGDRFSDLARKLERWYNIDIHFEDAAARELTFDGSLENETVEQAFMALEAAVPFRFTISNNEVYISSVGKPVSGVAH